MNLLFAVLQAHEAAAEGPKVFALTTGVMFWTIIIFGILLFILGKFAFPPILGYAAAREKRIQDALDQARADREAAAAQLEEQRQAVVRAREEAHNVVAEAQKAAERVRRELLDKARAEQEEVIARAKADIESERVKAIDSLRREAVDLAIAAASHLVHKKMDTQEDRRVVTEFLSNIDSGSVAAKR